MTRSLQKATIATVEKLSCFQMYSEWSCEKYIKIWCLSSTSNSCIVMAYVNPSQNAPEKPHLDGLVLNWMDKSLLYTAPV